MSDPFDWAGMLRTGRARLGLMPDQVWALTPMEFRLLLGDGPSTAPLSRKGLNSLLDAFPDQVERPME